MRQQLEDKLQPYGQTHLLSWWDNLDTGAQTRLADQIQAVNFDEIQQLNSAATTSSQDDQKSAAEKSHRAKPPKRMVRLPKNASEKAEWTEAISSGRDILAAGRVGVILVAGGQGTRLGFPHPKGKFPIGPVSGKPMFQLLAEQLIARARQAGAVIPCYIMTSDATHDETVAFFDEHDYFGMDSEDVHFFRQGWMPAVDPQSGKLLLAAPGELASSPDGHGGMLAALANAGLIDDMRRRGVDLLFYHQVDNPLCRVCDPAFLGFHHAHDSEATTKVVAKTGPQEKMGVVVDVDGQTQIIEYSDLPDDVAAEADKAGQLRFWAGSTAIHIFNRQFLEQLTADGIALPFHIAHKKVPHIDESGNLIEPTEPNAHKFERFIFDALPLAERTLVIEAAREDEFNPLKNAEGVNSPDDVKRSLVELYRRWLQAAGMKVPDDAVVEISPLLGVDEHALAAANVSDVDFSNPLYLRPNENS